MKKPVRHIAFLRGINVGGNVIVKMSELAEAFVSLGFTNVKTYINSGNVLFDTEGTDEEILVKKIEKKLVERFGRELRIILRTQKELQKLIEDNPFRKYELTDKRLYPIVTFVSGQPVETFTLPYTDEKEGLTLVLVSNRVVCSVLDRENLAKTGNAMKRIEKAFPGLTTTRTWNMLQKIADL